MFSITRLEKPDENFISLVKLLDADLDARYGTLQQFYNQFNSLSSIKNFVIAYDNSNPIGCGSFKEFDKDSVEIKRMFVHPDNRGSGAANQVLSELERWASELGYTKAVLETGIKQHEAIRFYTRNGYTTIENFGQYAGNPNSICMSKEIGNL